VKKIWKKVAVVVFFITKSPLIGLFKLPDHDGCPKRRLENSLSKKRSRQLHATLQTWVVFLKEV
jgi:hypothetical protein